MPQGLPRKIRIAFLLQVVLVSLAVILAGWLVSLVIRVGFIRSASEAEAADYFARKGMDAGYSLPHGSNFKSWFVPDGKQAPTALPASIARLPAGHYDLRDQDMQVRVAKGDGGTLYIVYDQDRIDRLMYAYAVLPVALGLGAVFAVSLLSYRVSKRLVTPVNWLASRVKLRSRATKDSTRSPSVCNALANCRASPLPMSGGKRCGASASMLGWRGSHAATSRASQFTGVTRRFDTR